MGDFSNSCRNELTPKKSDKKFKSENLLITSQVAVHPSEGKVFSSFYEPKYENW